MSTVDAFISHRAAPNTCESKSASVRGLKQALKFVTLGEKAGGGDNPKKKLEGRKTAFADSRLLLVFEYLYSTRKYSYPYLSTSCVTFYFTAGIPYVPTYTATAS